MNGTGLKWILPLGTALALIACRDGSPFDPQRCERSSAGCDLDGDGHASLETGGADCDDLNASIHPGAEDIPYDDIDQDCSGLDLEDVDGDGARAEAVGGDDCDDVDPLAYPDAYEVPLTDGDLNCNGIEDRVYLVAGNGEAGFNGDGLPASRTQVNQPAGMCFASDGALLFADTANYRIRRIGPDGIVTTIAGTGVSGPNGDNGPATAAQLSAPRDIALDALGNLYISDGWSGKIRRVDTSGKIVAWAGSGEYGDAGDEGPATEAALRQLEGIVLDAAGDLYIVDGESNRVRRIDAERIIHAYAGTGMPGSSGDGGFATAARLQAPRDIVFDPAGNAYISDMENARIRRVNPGGIITTVAGTGENGDDFNGAPATVAELNIPHGLALDAYGNLYIADSGNAWVRKLDVATGTLERAAGFDNGSAQSGDVGDDVPANEAMFYLPTAVAVDAGGAVFIADTYNHRIKLLQP